jgi:hypothetical protein
VAARLGRPLPGDRELVASPKELRGLGRWDDALALTEDPLARADILNEQALFTGSPEVRLA